MRKIVFTHGNERGQVWSLDAPETDPQQSRRASQDIPVTPCWKFLWRTAYGALIDNLQPLILVNDLTAFPGKKPSCEPAHLWW
ncbi:MAG TPA: hypothetical protein VLV76_26490 [Candidatus Acidoferrum sp.]|nr:hypothetical protein [Candidatus Acidoferrum sp.]